LESGGYKARMDDARGYFAEILAKNLLKKFIANKASNSVNRKTSTTKDSTFFFVASLRSLDESLHRVFKTLEQ
jgi:hypothetical protein